MAHRSIPKGPAGIKCRRGRQNSRFSTNIWLSVDNSCSANNNCYGDRSGSGSLSGNVLSPPKDVAPHGSYSEQWWRNVQCGISA